MQTFPCEHRVVCRKCFIRTIQVAVAQRSLPLRCVVCRTRILKLRHAGSAPGSAAVSVSAESPYHSSSAPPAAGHPPSFRTGGHDGAGFMVSGLQGGGVGTAHNRIRVVASLGKIAPCRPSSIAGGLHVGRKEAGKSSSSSASPSSSAQPSSFFVPDPPRVTLTGPRSSPVVRARQHPPHQHEASSSSSMMKGSSSPASRSTGSVTSTTRGDVIASSQVTAASKANATNNNNSNNSNNRNAHSSSSKRGRVFPFKPLFWR